MLKKLWKNALCCRSTGRFFMPELPRKRDGQDIRNSYSRCGWWAKAQQATSSDGVRNPAAFLQPGWPPELAPSGRPLCRRPERRHQRAGKAAGSLSVGPQCVFTVNLLNIVQFLPYIVPFLHLGTWLLLYQESFAAVLWLDSPPACLIGKIQSMLLGLYFSIHRNPRLFQCCFFYLFHAIFIEILILLF